MWGAKLWGYMEEVLGVLAPGLPRESHSLQQGAPVGREPLLHPGSAGAVAPGVGRGRGPLVACLGGLGTDTQPRCPPRSPTWSLPSLTSRTVPGVCWSCWCRLFSCDKSEQVGPC